MRNKLIFVLLLLPVWAVAQVRFGYISYADVCKQMPVYAQAQQQLADLKGKYEQEATRGEEEFQRKFSDFLQGQKEFPANILLKRQAELQDLMERSIAFRKEAQAFLDNTEKELMKDVYAELNIAIKAVAEDYGYAFVLNTDDNAAPYVNPQLGDDISDVVRVKLGILKEIPVVVEPTTVEPVEILEVDTTQPADTGKVEESNEDPAIQL